jgi:hypothetical protein
MDELNRKFAETNTSSTSVRPNKIVYKVEEPDDDEYEQGPRRLEQVNLVNVTFLARSVKMENIIVDTGSNHNLIGRNLVKILNKNLEDAGEKLCSEDARKFFQFGGGQPTRSDTVIKVPINLSGSKVIMDVYVVEQNVPFLMGGRFLRDLDAQISMRTPALILKGGRKVNMKTLDSGHLAIEWTSKIHKSPKVSNTFLSEKLKRKDYDTPEVWEAMNKEMRNLHEHGTYEEVKRERHMTVIPSLWVINRHTEDGKVDSGKVKARLVVQGNLDQGIMETPSDSPTVDRHSVKLALSVAASKKWKVRTMDVSAAFLQGKPIERVVHVEPPKEFKKTGTVWRLRKGLYGLREASRLWFEELSAYLISKGGQKLLGDDAVFLFFRDGKLVGIVCIHVDDIIGTGDDVFHEEVIDGIKNRFKISKDQAGNFTYTGMSVWTDSKGQVHLDQNKYIEEMEELCAGIEDDMTDEQCKGVVRQTVGKLLYLNLTRPDIAFRINMLSRLTPGENQKDKVKQARTLIADIKKTKVEIKYVSLGNLESLYLEVHADASFGNVDEKTRSTEGAVIILRGSEGTGAPIYWRSKVIARVCKSAKSAETFALEDAIDTAINIG